MKTLKSSLKFSVVEITPKDAEVLLSKYLHNRPISRDNINKYAIQMSEGKSENDFIKEISGKVYVKAGTDSVDVINLQTRRTKRYKVQYT